MNEIVFPATYGLIAANVIISLAGLNSRSIMQHAVMWPYGVHTRKEYYRFITSGFLHADLMHLFFNMFTLFFFGRNIEFLFTTLGLGGRAAYLLLYFSALIISDVPSYLKHRRHPEYHSLGASGAVSAVVFASIIFTPWQAIYL